MANLPNQLNKLIRVHYYLRQKLQSNYNIIINIEFEWDAVKASLNKKKHNISFEEANTVFFDENAIVIHDPEHSDLEDRFVMLGLSAAARLLVVCHCFRCKNNVIRIFSARKATKKESFPYQGGVHEKRI